MEHTASLFGRKLELKARYTYDDRDNSTPRDIYVRVAGDTQNQLGLISANARINWFHSLERHKFELDGGYRITSMTKLTLGYEYESKERDFSEVENTDVHKVKVKLSAGPYEIASGWIKYEYSSRDGSNYVSNQLFLDSHNPAYIATLVAD